MTLLSANPIHDTGGGQRSAQIALELLARHWTVLFVSHGEVTETVDLGLSFQHARLIQRSLTDLISEPRLADACFDVARSVVITQVPVPEWLPILDCARRRGATCVYDLIDRWDSELGYGWYRRRHERRTAARSDHLVATAPTLRRYLTELSGRSVHLIPNAFNARVFHPGPTHPRPPDLPPGPVALYVGSLWGSWMDWTLVAEAARALPTWAFVFVGDRRDEGAGLPGNCFFLGLKAQEDLPAYLAHASAGILPWRPDRITQATSPLKVFEYLAMGLPVVAPELEPLQGLPGIDFFEGSQSFVAALGTAVARQPGSEQKERVAAFIEKQSWTERVDALLTLAATPTSRPQSRGIVEWARSHLGTR